MVPASDFSVDRFIIGPLGRLDTLSAPADMDISRRTMAWPLSLNRGNI